MGSNWSPDGKKIWIAGHGGMVGSALVRRLESEDCQILTATRQQLDLCRQSDVESWVSEHKPDAIFIAAATVGGILANDTRPGEFIYDNAAIVSNIIHAAHLFDTGKLMFLGSSCIYPRGAEQPIKEDTLLSAPLEPTNQWYALAKIMGLKLCQAYRRQYGRDFIAVVPTNLYGPGDNFDLETSHVFAALINKIHTAKKNGGPVNIWGTGNPKREFVYVDDAADAMIYLMRTHSDEAFINIAGGETLSIRGLAETIAKVIGYDGVFEYDASKPDGMPEKSLDASAISALDWKPQTSLRDGIEKTYQWYCSNA